MSRSGEDHRIRRGLYLANALADERYLPQQEARAYVLRERLGLPVERVAMELDVSESRVYNAASAATERLADMRSMLTQLDEDDELPRPDGCAECDGAVQRWTIDERGRALCLDCAGVEP